MKQSGTLIRCGILSVVFVLFCMCFTTALHTQPVYAADHVMQQEIVDGPNTPSENNAYIIFSDSPREHKMSFEDGVGTDRYKNETYNEKIKFDGVECRQVWKENYLYMRLDTSFASPEDSVFRIDVDYWDYSGIGWFFIDYTKADSDSVYGRVSVLKEGNPDGDPKWHRLTVYITDASFRQCMPYGCDLKIVTNAFNAFSKIEVTNLSAGKGDSTEEIGVFNKLQANALQFLGLYDGGAADDAEANPFLTQEEFIRCFYTALGKKDEVISAAGVPKASGVSDAAKAFVGYAEKQGLLSDDFAPQGRLTEAQMLDYYLRYFGFSGYDAQNPYAKAKECGLILGNEVVFQMKKDVTHDNFVGVAANALMVRPSSGREPLAELLEAKKITGRQISESGYGKLYDWMMKRGFYNGAREIIDPETGRSYYAIDLLGQDAIKNYFTMPLTTTDDTRFYFRDEMFRIYEYNMKTGMVQYIDQGLHRMEHCFTTTPQNHLFYLNEKQEIIKMDCDTYERTKVGEIPAVQRNFNKSMLQVSFDEKKLTFQWKDNAGDFDSSVYSRLPVLNLETGEWDLRWIYGGFTRGWAAPNHNCINPYYNMQFFAHEGQDVLDRVWVVDMDTGEYKCVSNQRDYNLGTISGDSAVHEYWCYCGKHIGWVSGPSWNGRQSTSCSQGNLSYANADGTNRVNVNDDYGYNHSSMSPDHRWIVSDTQLRVGDRLNLVLVDTKTGESHLLARPKCIDNPGHTHPQFSWDGTKVFFGVPSEDYQHTNIAWMDISDYTTQPLPEGGEYSLSDTCDTFGYMGFEHYIKPKEDAEGAYYHIPKGNKLYVQTKAEVTEDRHADIVVSVTYLDKGQSDLNLHYIQYDIAGMVARRKSCTASLPRHNSGKWVTREIELTNVDMQNPYKLGADLMISGQLSAADVRTVRVRVAE